MLFLVIQFTIKMFHIGFVLLKYQFLKFLNIKITLFNILYSLYYIYIILLYILRILTL